MIVNLECYIGTMGDAMSINIGHVMGGVSLEVINDMQKLFKEGRVHWGDHGRRPAPCGLLHAFGKNRFGQCFTGSWEMFPHIWNLLDRIFANPTYKALSNITFTNDARHEYIKAEDLVKGTAFKRQWHSQTIGLMLSQNL